VTEASVAVFVLLSLGWGIVSGALARRNLTGPLVFTVAGTSFRQGVQGLDRPRAQRARLPPHPLEQPRDRIRRYVSLNTLKTHLQSTYRKPCVDSRAAAVDRATHLGLL
jgi:hypothetical protein